MSRKFFRNISVLVILSLIILAMVQMLWVRRLYLSLVADFTRRVELAAYKSVYKAFYVTESPELSEDLPITIDLDIFSLYFKPSLLEFDVLQPYAVEVLYQRDETIVMMKRGQKAYLKYPTTIDIPIDATGKYILRLFIEVPLDVFFNRMSGLVFSSIAIVFLLSGMLIYLIRTMYKQKSLDDMRRDFTHNITHELKTPISVAITATDALRNFSADADVKKRSRYLEIVESQLTQLSSMVEKILSVSVEGFEFPYRPVAFHVLPVIEQVIQDAKLNHEKKTVFHVDCPANLRLIADTFHIKNVLSTLIDNAIKYAAIPMVNVKVCVLKEEVVISIQDNGCGIGKEHLPHIFEKYYRVPTGDIQKVRGYGLGLYYAQQVIQLHKGKISAESRVGEGTTITVKLPDYE